MKHYTRLSEQERYLIEQGIRKRESISVIARSIARPTKTISLEIKRNGGPLKYYGPKAHYERNKSNRLGYSKIDQNKQMQNYIRSKLMAKWSPEIIAGRWNKENSLQSISHETIYSWIYRQPDKLFLFLPHKKAKRGFKPQRSKSKIPNRTSIHK
jgi:transposase, IS30 family